MLAVTCREAERLVMPYINGSITDGELKEFLKHIETCEECREELEIYFTVDVVTCNIILATTTGSTATIHMIFFIPLLLQTG